MADDINPEELRRKFELDADPEWFAKYGEDAWRAALTVLGYPLPETIGKNLPLRLSHRVEKD